MHKMVSDPEMEKILTRQRELHLLQPKCPSCRHEQVQLMNAVYPAEWRCLMCKARFTRDVG